MKRRTFLRNSTVLALGGLGGLMGRLTSFAADNTARDIGSQEQLFLDDWIIERTSGLSRTLHRPVKKGLIQEADGRPWERGGVTTAVRDAGGRFHMTYNLLYWDPSVRHLHPSIGDDKAHWFRIVPCYAVSDDGVRWQKPVLGLVSGPTGFRPAPREKWKDGVFMEPTGFSRENNQGCPIFGIQDLSLFGGVRDPKRRYLVNVIYKDSDHAFASITDAGLYFSPRVPGLVGDPNWRKRMEIIWEGPRRGPRGPNVLVSGYDERENVWFLCDQCTFGKIVQDGRQISRWTSADLIEWSAEQLVLPIAPDESHAPHDHVEYMRIEVRRIAGVWLGFLNVFHGDRSDPMGEMPTQKGVWRKGLTEYRLVVSRDAGKTWSRVAGKEPWLSPHQQEDGYDRLIGMGDSVVRVGDQLWLYYGCWDGDHLAWKKDGTIYYKDRMRIWRTALATLRWDGYVSFDAGQRAGQVITKPLKFTGKTLVVNLDALKGSLRTEFLDASGKPIPGYTAGDCEPAQGDGIEIPVTWRGDRDVESLAASTIQVRFELTAGSLYSFRFV
ncbi:MAG: hypothetical protein HY717_02175 [Planctomycetes bacterium]|nr:hypothetical protein [Planctomycetota bacterium]